MCKLEKRLSKVVCARYNKAVRDEPKSILFAKSRQGRLERRQLGSPLVMLIARADGVKEFVIGGDRENSTDRLGALGVKASVRENFGCTNLRWEAESNHQWDGMVKGS